MKKTLATLIALTTIGCTTPRQNLYLGQGLDMATTYYALEVDGRFEESNPMADNIEKVFLMKAAFIGFTETMAYFFPKNSDTIYNVGGIMGGIAGGININTLIKNQERRQK